MSVSVSFQGERGAYSEAAAVSFFSDHDNVKTVPYDTFAKALNSTANGNTDYTILPVENSIEGSVGESYDLLISTPLVAVAETHYRVRHCLIGYASSIDDVKTVWSHSQALGQCRHFLEGHEIKAMRDYDTAGIIKNKIKGSPHDVTTAGIASKDAAALYDVPIIAENIADNADNYTRFLILSRDEKAALRPLPTGHDKTSIIFSIKHEPGSLYKIMEIFYRNNVNMTKIESRPTKANAWEYNFYVDFEGHTDDPRISNMIKTISRDSLAVRVLGSYPSATEPSYG